MSGFAIHALNVGEGSVGISPIPGRGGQFQRDFAEVLRWNPAIVLTMTSSEELAQVDAAGFGDDLHAIGIRWFHYPIIDFGTPDADVDEKWMEFEGMCLKALAQKGRILFHCFGGCGRSGMAALRLMVRLGEDPADALKRLREARPCAVETDAQFDWAARRRG